MICRGKQGGTRGLVVYWTGRMSPVLSKATEGSGASMMICSGLDEKTLLY